MWAFMMGRMVVELVGRMAMVREWQEIELGFELNVLG